MVVLSAVLTSGVAGATGFTENKVPVMDQSYDLSAVACETAKVCIAVGDGNFSPDQGMILPITDGMPGTPRAVPNADNLTGIACPSPTSCVAVGSVAGSPHAEGVVVRITSGIAGAGEVIAGTYDLEAVACPGVTQCEAVGSNYSGGGFVVPITHVPGRNAVRPNYSGGDGGFVVPITNGVPGRVEAVPGSRDLNGIACPSAHACVAVGEPASTYGGLVVPMTNGTPGTLQIVPSAYELTAVACGSNTDCQAIGDSALAATSGTLQGLLLAIVSGAPQKPVLVAETTSGKWSEFSFTGIACATSSRCEAVGANMTVGQSAYRSVALPVKNGAAGHYGVVAGSSQLNGVACPSTDTCIGVGEQFYTTPTRGGTEERGLVLTLPV